MNNIEVIAPNLKFKLSGVTATIIRLVPLQAKRIGIVALAPKFPKEVPQVSFWKVITMPKNKWRVWHARRNTEMIVGLMIKWVLRKKMKMLFTSASQREHTWITKFLISKMDKVIATSQKTARYLEVPSKVIYHGIDIEKFKANKNKNELKQKFGINKDAFVVGCVGRIRHQKGTDLFVEACINIAKENDKFQGVVIGRANKKDWKYLNKLKSKIKNEGLEKQILFRNEVPVWEIVEYYQCLDLYVAPQRWEGFGLTPLEAMACEVPVVASDVGAFAEIVKENETGFVVDRDSGEEIEKAVRQIVGDRERHKEMCQMARKHVEEKFDIKYEAEKIVGVYKEMLEK